MQALVQDRKSSRVIIFSFIVLLIIAASWAIASNRAPGVGLDGDGGYSADSALRVSASVDEQIQNLQDRLRADPNDWQSYSQLGLAYLLKARETGDPTYYQKTEEALDKALSMQPSDYASISAKGALTLARHDFSAALEWGEKARQINPDRTYAYGVIADAQVELGRYDEAIQTLQTMVDLRPDMSSYSR